VTRESALPYLSSVCVALVTSRVRGVPTEVSVGREHGLARDSVISCDNLFTVRKRDLGRRRGALGPADLSRLRTALRIALDLD
jgi:mRNA interferase MazF